jgi:hypothetical protein
MIEEYIWKGEKILVNDQYVQNETKMVDMTENQLQVAYTHCKNMLYNTNKLSPGKYLILDNLENQLKKCNTELAIRWFCQLKDTYGKNLYTKFTLTNEINNFIEANSHIYKKTSKIRLKDIYNGIPVDFQDITIDYFIEGCMEKAGKIETKYLNNKLFENYGIWFTTKELKDFKETGQYDGDIDELFIVVKKILKIPHYVNLNMNPSGLSYNEFRSIYDLFKTKNKKYTDLTTLQLTTLRNKIIFNLRDIVKYNIKKWEGLLCQITEVAIEKKYNLR